VAEQVERLAHHALRGGCGPGQYFGRRGKPWHGQPTTSAGAPRQALSVLPHLPETPATREQAIDLRLALRSVLQPLGDLGRMLVCLREAEALAEALDHPRRLARISLFLSRYFSLIGTYGQAIMAAQRALALATASGDGVLHALANDNQPDVGYSNSGATIVVSMRLLWADRGSPRWGRGPTALDR
jgi:hypothetical protein